MAKSFRSRIPLIIKKPIRFLLREKNDFYYQQQFAPGIMGIWLNPFYLARKELRREMTRFAPLMHGRLLDVGCGSKPYRELFSFASDYVGLEFDSLINRVAKRADYFYDGNTFPFEDASYDGVICNQVLEHVFNLQCKCESGGLRCCYGTIYFVGNLVGQAIARQPGFVSRSSGIGQEAR
jgi:SAM-dependent methyltransferase